MIPHKLAPTVVIKNNALMQKYAFKILLKFKPLDPKIKAVKASIRKLVSVTIPI